VCVCDCVCYRWTSKTDKTRAGVCVKLHFARNGVALHWQLLATATARMQGACEVERVPVRSCTRVCMHASKYIFTSCGRARSDGLERHGLFAAGSLAPGSFAANTPRARLIRRKPDALCKGQESLRQHLVKRIWTMASEVPNGAHSDQSQGPFCGVRRSERRMEACHLRRANCHWRTLPCNPMLLAAQQGSWAHLSWALMPLDSCHKPRI
jgi:hypothetical protein